MKMILLLTALFAADAAQAADELRFVTCPVYRDTDAGKKSGCWLADDPATGKRYDVTSSPAKPDWNHAILVEGRPAHGKDDPCGGAVLDPVRVSVLDEPCTRFMLEAEGYAGRKFNLPTRNVRPLYEQRPHAAKPYAARQFQLPFEFGSHFVTYQLTDYYLDAMINYALDVAPAHITVVGYAMTDPVTISGRSLAERPELARERADLVARALVMRGVPAGSITVQTAKPAPVDAEPFDGLVEPSLRRADVTITPDPEKPS